MAKWRWRMQWVRSRGREASEQLRSVVKLVLMWFYLPALVLLAIVVAWVVQSSEVEPEALFRDVATIAEVPWYSGLVSQVGAALWAASAAVCILAYVILRSLGAARPRSQRFLLHAGLVSAFLLADDMFLLHEEVAAIHLSVEQRTVYVAYFLLLMAFVVGHRRELLASRWMVLAVSFVLLGASMGMDLVTDTFYESLLDEGSFYERYEVVFEDGMKLLGIVSWLAFFVLYVLDRFAAVPRGWLADRSDLAAEEGEQPFGGAGVGGGHAGR